MHILETFLLGKEHNPQTCEDGLFISEHLLAVIDGVTAKGSLLWNGQKSGCFAKNVLLESLSKITEPQNKLHLEKEDSAIWLLETLNADLREKSLLIYPDSLPNEEYPRASIILYNDFRKEIISYGDCPCNINGISHTHSKKIDVLNADLRAYYLEYALLQGKTIEELKRNDIGRTAISENLFLQFSFENKPLSFGYPVLNGYLIEPSLIKIYPVHENDVIILASDGYPELRNTLSESEALLKQLLIEDPLCFQRNRSTKGLQEGYISFDDRTFCKFQI